MADLPRSIGVLAMPGHGRDARGTEALRANSAQQLVLEDM
jgi:hypothetical protein